MFQQSITLIDKKADPDDIYGDGEQVVTTTLKGVRVDMRTTYSGTNNDRQIVANGTIVLMQPYTTPWVAFDQTYQGKKIVYNSKTYTISTINEDIEPFTNKIYQYKLGIVQG